ncbi:MAG: DUF4358 domain-containing protein [Lachnospiraceae bacterium]|nr:DUF4358 domain-containing protein [Lachnospiraceae bacterium]
MKTGRMTKWLIMAAALLVLAGCGSGDSEKSGAESTPKVEKEEIAAPKEEEKPVEAEEPAAQDLSLEEIYQNIAKEVELPPMYFADDDFLMNYYGIDASLLSEYVFASSEDAARVDSVILMKLKDPAEADVISGGLDGLLSQMEVEMDNYLPEAHELVTQAKVRRHGDILELVISAERDRICGIIDKLLP